MKFPDEYNTIYSHKDTSQVNVCVILETQVFKNEPYDKGIAHFVEHVIFRRLSNYLSKSSCKVYAETNNIYTYYTIKGYIDDLDAIISSINIIIAPTIIKSKEVNSEIEIVINELRTKNENALYSFNKKICRLYYNNCMDILGNSNLIYNIGLNQVNDFLFEKYTKERILINIQGNEIVLEKLNDLINKNIDKNAVIYFNNSIVSIYFAICGLSSNIFYVFNIFKIMILNELYLKYKGLKVKIIKPDTNKAYLIVSCYSDNENIKEKLFLDTKNIINDAELYRKYSKKMHTILSKKLNNSEFKTCLVSILYLCDIYDVNYFAFHNMKFSNLNDYEKAKSYINLKEPKYIKL